MLKKRLAIQFFGHMRTYEKTYKFFLKNIVEANILDGWEIDIFIHTWNKFNSSCKSWHESLNLFNNNRNLDINDISKIKQVYKPKKIKIDILEEGKHGGLLSKVGSNELRKQYETEKKISYDYILYTRPDLLFITPLKLNSFIDIYCQNSKFKILGLPEKHTFCCNNFFRSQSIADPRLLNEADLVYFSNVEQNFFLPESNRDFTNISINYTLHKDFFLQRENFIHGWRSHPIHILEDKLKEMQSQKSVQISTLTNEKNSLQNEKTSLQTQIAKLQNSLNSIPTKKANLEVSNLEQELKNKKLEELKLKKDLGTEFIKNITINLQYPNSAVARMHSHLSYKLGTALIINSKSILGYMRMPFILSFIKEQHKAEKIKFEKALKENPNLTLPPLESYPDYQEALKEKECFTYKLGEAFIKAHKNWYGGGYIKFILKDVPRLKREFKERSTK